MAGSTGNALSEGGGAESAMAGRATALDRLVAAASNAFWSRAPVARSETKNGQKVVTAVNFGGQPAARRWYPQAMPVVVLERLQAVKALVANEQWCCTLDNQNVEHAEQACQLNWEDEDVERLADTCNPFEVYQDLGCVLSR